MWKLRIEDDQSNRTVVNLVRKEYTVGRAEDNGVRLTERNVSRSHAKLARSGDGWLLTDLDSYTGTFVDEQRVKGHVTIGHDAHIRIGDYSLLLFDDAQQSVANDERDAMTLPAPLPSNAPPTASDRFVVLLGPNEGAEYPLGNRRLLVGRGEECDIALNDTSVSRVHADIERDESGRYRIGDLGSSNGLRVNGMEVQDTTLYSGDIVELGDVELQFVPAGQIFSRSDHPRAAHARGGLWQQLTSAQKWVAGLIGTALVVTAAAWGFSPQDTAGSQRGAEQSEATQALERARKLLAQNQFDAAHQALSAIGPESNLRASRAFARVEAAWADSLMQRAETASNLDVKRRLLDAVAKAETVDTVRRRTAVNRLEELDAESVEPSDLPEAMNEDDAGHTAKATITIEDEQPVDKPSPRPRPKSAAPKPQSFPKPKPPVMPRPAAPAPKPVATGTGQTVPVTAPSPAPPPAVTPAPTPQTAPKSTTSFPAPDN